MRLKASNNDFQETAFWKARVKFTSGITRVTGVTVFTGGHPDDKVENATEVWLDCGLIALTFTRVSSCLCRRVAAFHKWRWQHEFDKGRIWNKKPPPLNTLCTLHEASSLQIVPQIKFKSVSFEWVEETGNNKQHRRKRVWRYCTGQPGGGVDSRLSLIWMKQRLGRQGTTAVVCLN